MSNQVNFSAIPDYSDHLRGLGDSDLHFLLRAGGFGPDSAVVGDVSSGLSLPIAPHSKSERISALISEDAAFHALSRATIDVIAVVQLIHVLEDSATIDDLVSVAFMASEADTSPHDKGQRVSKVRKTASKSELLWRLHRARNVGLVWEQPAGVWNVPPHISRVFGEEPTMATPVQCLIDLVEPSVLRQRMASLGLAETDEELSESEVLARLRAFLCSPAKVRALVAGAPLKVQKQLEYFSREAIRLDRRRWGSLRADAVEWAEQHLLAVSFTTPTEAGDELNASMVSPVALALRGDEWYIPLPHEREQYPAPGFDHGAGERGAGSGAGAGERGAGAAEPGAGERGAGAAEPGGRPAGHNQWQAAVNVASAYMQWAGSVEFSIFEMEGRQQIVDYAVSIGADPGLMTLVVDMLIGAELLDADTNTITADGLEYWFTSTVMQRWSWLVAGWLRGRSPLHIARHWFQEFDVMSVIAAATQRRMNRELVMMAVELDHGHRYYRCCIDNHLLWEFQPAFDVLQFDPQASIDAAVDSAEALGIFYEGETSWTANCIAIALADAWFTEQDLEASEMALMISAVLAGNVDAGKQADTSKQADAGKQGDTSKQGGAKRMPIRVQLSMPARRQSDEVFRPFLRAQTGLVPANDLAWVLDFLAERDRTDRATTWYFTEKSVTDALEQLDWDVTKLEAMFASVVSQRRMRLFFRRQVDRIVHGVRLNETFMLPSAEPHVTSVDGADDDGPDQLSLF